MSDDPLKFDSSREAAGFPVHIQRVGGHWEDIHYIGPDKVRGGHVVQEHDGDIFTTTERSLRMKPRPKYALVFDSVDLAQAAFRTLQTNYDGYDNVTIRELQAES